MWVKAFMTRSYLKYPIIGISTLVGVLFLDACNNKKELAVPRDVSAIGRNLSGPINGQTPEAIDGTYTSCLTKTDGALWSVGINGFAGTLDNSLLEVVKNNTPCQIRIAQLQLGGVKYEASTPLLLGSSFLGSPIAFTKGGATTPDFYANAKITPGDYSADFRIDIVYSSDPASATASQTATYFFVYADPVAATQVPAPDYSANISSISFQVDANNIIQTASGTGVFSEGDQAGQEFAIIPASSFIGDKTNYEDVLSNFTAASKVSIVGTSFVIPATGINSFNLVGKDTGGPGYVVLVIVANTDEDSGVVSLQVYTITFNHP